MTQLAEEDREGQARETALRKGLQELGWAEQLNIQIDFFRSKSNLKPIEVLAVELVNYSPDVALVSNTLSAKAILQQTRQIPIVFVQILDPVGSGLVASLARPGGNITGFAQFETSVGVKWLELLKQLAPQVQQVAFIHNPSNPVMTGLLTSIQTNAASYGVQIAPLAVKDGAGTERAINEFSAKPNGGLIVPPGPPAIDNRDLIIALAATHRLPAVYAGRYYAESGGLASYGIDNIDQWHRAAGYVDRILKGEKAAELPVQYGTKFELVINLKTARSLGLEIPISLLARTDEVIE